MRWNMDDNIVQCQICKGFGWICENHQGLPFDHDDECGGAGDPCICNPNYEPRLNSNCEKSLLLNP